MIEIHPPLALHEKGKRPDNEDFIFPRLTALNQTGGYQNLFIVCDGVGGAESGEQASRIAGETISSHLLPLNHLTAADISKALSKATKGIDQYIAEHPATADMATTLAMLWLNPGSAVLAHIGDSRIYHIRKGQILFTTSDHSIVRELVQNGIISEEDALRHPKRNVISRAIMRSENPCVPDIAEVTDISPGDYFFLCTDGILESVRDSQLAAILEDEEAEDASKLESIRLLCQEKSNDNYSCYLIRIKSVDGKEASGRLPGPAEERIRDASLWSRMLPILTKVSLGLFLAFILAFIIVQLRPVKPAAIENAPAAAVPQDDDQQGSSQATPIQVPVPDTPTRVENTDAGVPANGQLDKTN